MANGSGQEKVLENRILQLKAELAYRNTMLGKLIAASHRPPRGPAAPSAPKDAAGRSPYQDKQSAARVMEGAYSLQFPGEELDAERERLEAGNAPAAFRNLGRFLAADSLTAEQAATIGEGCYTIGYPAHAERFFLKAIAMDPGDSASLNNLGMINLGRGNLREAERMFFLAFEKSLDKKSWHEEAKRNLSALYAVCPQILHPDVDAYMQCPCCERAFPSFLPFAIPPSFNILCPQCNSLPRHRMLWMYLMENRDGLLKENMRVLHFAPEGVLQELFASLPGVDYVTADLYMPNVTHRMDITDIRFGDDSFDAVVCVHVLEHIPDDRKAMKELHRVLKPGGWALLQSPMRISLEKTYEDPSIVSEEERFRHFGQHDHVRIYGRDYAERLEKAGFRLTVEEYCRRMPEDKVRRMGLNRSEDIYIGRK